MKKYVITVLSNSHYGKTFDSTSRNAKHHLIENGGNTCIVKTVNGKFISKCCYSPEFGYYYAAN